MHQLSCMRAVAALVILMIPGHPGPRQAEEPEARARVLPAGVTEMELIRSVIPEYDQELVRWGKRKDGTDLFRPSVWEALETDLGFAGRRHVLFAVGGQGFICAQCGFFRVGVFDIERRKLLFRHDHSGIGPEPAVRTFHLAGDGQRLCISFREGGGSLNMGGFFETTEEWYRPRLRADGTLEFDHIWSGLIARSYTDNVSWNHESICGRIQPLNASSRHEYRQTARFGVLKPDGNPATAFSDEEWELPECVCDRCGVEIRRLERWDYDRRARRLVRRSERLSRIDLFPVPAFPFDLPVRKPSYRRLAARVPVEFGGSRGTRVTSPTGDGVIVWDPVAWKVDKVELRIVSAVGDDLFRTVSIRSDAFVWGIDSLGWEKSGRRIFLVVRIGRIHRALLSFSTVGHEDYWEDLVTSDSPLLQHGFVLVRDETGAGRPPLAAQPMRSSRQVLGEKSRQPGLGGARAMPTAMRSGPYRIYFVSHDSGEPPHVHVDRENRSAKLWLDPISLARNIGFHPRELRAIRRLIAENQERLLRSWHEYFEA